ncbi:MAG: DUF5658 family protein [Phycisphaerales bacterium]
MARTNANAAINAGEETLRALGWRQPPLRYQQFYLWLVTVSALDVMFTWIILALGGSELNPVADAVIVHWGLNGMIAFKFALTLLVIVLCEIVGRAKDATGRRLAGVCAAIASIPVVVGMTLLMTAA